MRDFSARHSVRAIPAVPHPSLEQQCCHGPAQGHTEMSGKLLKPTQCQPWSHTDPVFWEQCTSLWHSECSGPRSGSKQSQKGSVVSREAKSCGGFGSCLIPSSSWTRNSRGNVPGCIPCLVCAHSFPLSGALCL